VFAQQTNAKAVTADEEKVWKLEQSYWEYVKVLDVASYKTLWHKICWLALYSSCASGQDHIADWVEDERKEQNSCNATNWNTPDLRKWAM